MSSAHTHTHPTLDRPLPPDLAAYEAAFIRFYQKYPVFSWSWTWRRTLVFGSVTALVGILFGASHGMHARVVWEGVAVAAVCGLANVILVAAGPCLATAARHARFPRGMERLLVVAAVLCGMVLAARAGDLASQYHDHLMAAHGSSKPAPTAAPVYDLHRIVMQVLSKSDDLFVLFIAGGGLALASYFREPKRWAEHQRRVDLENENLRRSASDLELKILQAQVEPHFLFNTLASVRSLIASDPPRAAQTVDALARHLRATLPKLRADARVAASTLGEQFAICASYLELMTVRLGDRLRVEIELPEALRTAPFPPLLLISLVENAIKHGVEPKPGAARVSLCARSAEGKDRQLEVRVEDDGVGLALGMGEGTGLANVRAQLRTRFGAAASFELTERAAGGVLARLRVPLES